MKRSMLSASRASPRNQSAGVGRQQAEQTGPGAKTGAGVRVAQHGAVGQGMECGDGGRDVEVVAQGFEDRGRGRPGGRGAGAVERAIEAVELALTVSERVVGEIQDRTVMGAHQGQAEGLARCAGEGVADGGEVAKAFRHLLAVDLEHGVVHPKVGEVAARVGAEALGALVLVVGEDQVFAAEMDVEILAEMGLAHGAALDVPAGAAAAPGTVPARLGVVGRLPKHEVGGVALVGGDFDACAGDEVLDVAARQGTVAAEGSDREQDVAFGGVGRGRDRGCGRSGR